MIFKWNYMSAGQNLILLIQVVIYYGSIEKRLCKMLF